MAERAQLGAALDFCRARDALIVTRLDETARSYPRSRSIVDIQEAKGVYASHPRHGPGHCHGQRAVDPGRAGLGGSNSRREVVSESGSA